MAFKRKRRTRRIFRRGGKRRRFTMAKKIKRVVSRMEETKFITNYFGTQPTAALPTLTLLNHMAQGSVRNARLGNRISMKSIRWISRAQPLATQVAGCTIRLILFYDKQANGVALAPGTTLGDLFLDPTVANWYIAMQNPNTVGRRYQILYDRVFKLDVAGAVTVVAGTTTQAADEQKIIRIHKILKRTTQYNEGNAGTVADIISPALYMAMFTDGNVVVNSEVMFKFKDA